MMVSTGQFNLEFVIKDPKTFQNLMSLGCDPFLFNNTGYTESKPKGEMRIIMGLI